MDILIIIMITKFVNLIIHNYLIIYIHNSSHPSWNIFLIIYKNILV